MRCVKKICHCIGKKGKKKQPNRNEKRGKNQPKTATPGSSNRHRAVANQRPNRQVVSNASAKRKNRQMTAKKHTTSKKKKNISAAAPWSGTKYVKQFAQHHEDTCWDTFMDNVSYKMIRIKKFFKGKPKKDVLEMPNYDPFTGEAVLTGAEKPMNELAEEAESEVKCLTYSAELHDSLKYFWWAVELTGRLPFRVKMAENSTTISMKMEYCSIPFFINFLTCIFLWGMFGWITCGFYLIHYDNIIPNSNIDDNTTDTGLPKAVRALKSRRVESRLLRRYWLDIWFFHTTLFHLACITTHQCIYGKKYVLFFKRWYKELDFSKVRVHESLQNFYLILYTLGGVVILIMIIAYSLRQEFPAMYLTIELILAAFMYPLYIFETDEESRRYYVGQDKHMYFEDIGLEVVVFLLYCWVLTAAWVNCIIHLTFSRSFQNGIRLLNERVRMVLLPFEEPKIGPNAVRVTPQEVQGDYAHFTAAGMQQNKVFGFAIMSDMMWTLLTIYFEVMVLTFYGFVDPAHPEYEYRFKNYYENTEIKQLELYWPYLVNSVGHILITGIRMWIIVWLPDLVFREAQVGYRIATQKGLILCETQLERNLVRSMWLMSVPKFPVIITANYYFKLSRGMICALIAAVATYYIFSMQAKSDLEKLLLGDWERDMRKLYKEATGKEPIDA